MGVTSPPQLLYYVIPGLCCGLTGLLYACEVISLVQFRYADIELG